MEVSDHGWTEALAQQTYSRNDSVCQMGTNRALVWCAQSCGILGPVIAEHGALRQPQGNRSPLQPAQTLTWEILLSCGQNLFFLMLYLFHKKVSTGQWNAQVDVWKETFPLAVQMLWGHPKNDQLSYDHFSWYTKKSVIILLTCKENLYGYFCLWVKPSVCNKVPLKEFIFYGPGRFS